MSSTLASYKPRNLDTSVIHCDRVGEGGKLVVPCEVLPNGGVTFYTKRYTLDEWGALQVGATR